MATPYIGEIRMFGGNFAPLSWAVCQGQTVAIPQNEVLFNLIGTTYGGDGQSTFKLPDLQGRIPIHQGTLASEGRTFVIGESSGTEQVALNVAQIPPHSHTPLVQPAAGNSASPANATWSGSPIGNYNSGVTPANAMYASSIQSAGGNQSHENRMPYLALNYIIALNGIYPSMA